MEVNAHSHTDTTIECVIVQFNSCNLCVQKYRDIIKPFYDQYNNIDNITFLIIDASTNYSFFQTEMQRIDVNITDHGLFPWVVFSWNETQTEVLDANELGLIYSTFENIINDIYEDPNGNDTSPTTSFDIIDFGTLLVACITIVGPLLLILVVMQTSEIRSKRRINLLRIEKRRFYLFSGLTLVSLISLTYQFLDYINGGCGCVSPDIVKILLFREYEVFDFFMMEIPLSLLGIVLMVLIYVQVFLVGIIPFPIKIPYFSGHTFLFTTKQGKYWYYFIIFQLLMTIVAFINLLYIELFVIHFICLLCTLSQIIIVINTILVLTWSPFKNSFF
ncbi:MAG: hypothetical protein ACW99Q_20445 [Candidatus Kariarchaeaceae archaeon]